MAVLKCTDHAREDFGTPREVTAARAIGRIVALRILAALNHHYVRV
jgi:hypothetical protein